MATVLYNGMKKAKKPTYSIVQSKKFGYIQTRLTTYIHVYDLGLIKSIPSIDTRKMIRDGVQFFDYTKVGRVATIEDFYNYGKGISKYLYTEQIEQYCKDNGLIIKSIDKYNGHQYIHLDIEKSESVNSVMETVNKNGLKCRICGGKVKAALMFSHYKNHWTNEADYYDNKHYISNYYDHEGITKDQFYDVIGQYNK